MKAEHPQGHNRPKRRSGLKSTIVKIAVVAFTLYIVVTAIILRIDIQKREEELAELNAQLDEQKILNDELSQILESGDASEYIIRIAREKLGFVFPDERVFVDISGK